MHQNNCLKSQNAFHISISIVLFRFIQPLPARMPFLDSINSKKIVFFCNYLKSAATIRLNSAAYGHVLKNKRFNLCYFSMHKNFMKN